MGIFSFLCVFLKEQVCFFFTVLWEKLICHQDTIFLHKFPLLIVKKAEKIVEMEATFLSGSVEELSREGTPYAMSFQNTTWPEWLLGNAMYDGVNEPLLLTKSGDDDEDFSAKALLVKQNEHIVAQSEKIHSVENMLATLLAEREKDRKLMETLLARPDV